MLEVSVKPQDRLSYMVKYSVPTGMNKLIRSFSVTKKIDVRFHYLANGNFLRWKIFEGVLSSMLQINTFLNAQIGKAWENLTRVVCSAWGKGFLIFSWGIVCLQPQKMSEHEKEKRMKTDKEIVEERQMLYRKKKAVRFIWSLRNLSK